MALAVLIVATVIDLGLAALLVGVSGFVFGSGPASMSGEPLAASAWTAVLALCFVAPIVGFVMRAAGRPVGGILIALLPPVLGLIAASAPAPY